MKEYIKKVVKDEVVGFRVEIHSGKSVTIRFKGPDESVVDGPFHVLPLLVSVVLLLRVETLKEGGLFMSIFSVLYPLGIRT